MMLVLLIACASTEPGNGTTGVDSGFFDSGSPWWEQPAGDADGDGFTFEEGDCDDADPQVNPGLSTDSCDGLDNDCDGSVDEDFDGDDYEPNDQSAFFLGRMEDGDEFLVFGYLFPGSPDPDVDRYQVFVTDSDWSWFSLEAWLYGVPDDADYALELIWVEDLDGIGHGTVDSADDEGLGGYEVVDFGGLAGGDDSGTYEVVVSSVSGSDCSAPYTLQVLLGGW